MPERWLPGIATSAPGDSDAFPADLQTRRQRFMAITILDDLDGEDDDPEFADAAGKEPAMFIWGGALDDEAALREHVKTVIGPWCQDFEINVVDMYEWLFPMRVDPDEVEEEHRAGHEKCTEELNTVMQRRKTTLQQSRDARRIAAQSGTAINEVNVNRALPDLHESHGREPVEVTVTQLDAEGRELAVARGAPPRLEPAQ